jgi:hypothetical protein
MTLKGIKLTGDSAVDAGGFGDIWRGLLKDKEIAVKVLRIVRQSDKDKVLKVGHLSRSLQSTAELI